MKSTVFITVTSIFFFTAAALSADQATWIAKDSAGYGVRLLKSEKKARLYCAPCKDAGFTPVKIKEVTMREVDTTAHLFEISINGKPVDLAYTYVKIEGKWTNVALNLGLKVTGVPALLPKGIKNLNKPEKKDKGKKDKKDKGKKETKDKKEKKDAAGKNDQAEKKNTPATDASKKTDKDDDEEEED